MNTSPQKTQFDHEKLNVYQLSLEFAAFVHRTVESLAGTYRNAREQLLRSSQSIPLNIAEGNGKRSSADRKRFFEIARGSAMESAATLDVLVAIGACSREETEPGKALLVRIVQMLSRMTEPVTPVVREDEALYASSGRNVLDYEHDSGRGAAERVG